MKKHPVRRQVCRNIQAFHEDLTRRLGLLRGRVPRGGGSLIFPKVPQSSRTESLGTLQF